VHKLFLKKAEINEDKVFKSKIFIIITTILFLLTLTSKTIAGNVSYYIYDAPGRSVTAITDTTGEAINKYTYDAFGSILTTSQNIQNSFKYVGEQYDQEAGNIYLRNRYYNPEIGRFITKDPAIGFIREPQSKNPYPYCQNNPIRYTDPNGNELVGAAAGAIIGGAWGLGTTFVGDIFGILSGNQDRLSDLNVYVGNTTGGIVGGALGGLTFNPVIAGAAGGAVSNLIKQGAAKQHAKEEGKTYDWNIGSYVTDVVFSAAFSGLDKALTPAVRGAKPELLETMLLGAHAQAKYFGKFQSDILEAGVKAAGIKESITDRMNTGVNSLMNLSSNIYATPSFMAANFGGVSLSKTAQLLTDLSEIKGAFYDDKTGQIILMGKQNMNLPQMKLDDLAVAVNSVYAGTDPGVSIDPPLVNNLFSVRYDGKTSNTEFGYIMFESDRIMKTLVLGKDNITGNPVSSTVSGYKNLLNRFKDAGGLPGGSSELAWRFWFKPKEMKLVQSTDGNSMVFDTAAMELLTESKFQNNVIGDPQSEAFAQNLTQYYDAYANEWPILKDLKRLGQVVSVIKWIKDNDIPIDFSFIGSYQVPAYSTPTNTPATQAFTQWQDGNIIRTLTITGGVTYTKPNEYLTDPSNITDPLKQAAISQRPLETDFKWNFTSPQNESLTAVAESFSRLRKDGNLAFSSNDLSYPADCEFPLEFTRYYDSFYDKQSAFGFGWEYRPYQLRFPDKKTNFTFTSNNLILSLYSQVFVINRAGGQEDSYELLGIDSNNLPLYAKEGKSDTLREMTDGTLVLTKKDTTRITFDNQGRLVSTTDKNNKTISYTYQEGKLISINAAAAGAITLAYSADKITSVTGPGPRTISYGYDANSNLITVTNAENQSIHYEYDTDHRITRVTDPKGNLIFEGTYDDYNRLLTQRLNQELDFGRSFSLALRQTIETNPDANKTTKLYDDKFRVLEQTDHLGNKVNLTYDGDNGPKTVTDTKGAVTQYTYDLHGNISVVDKPDASQTKLYYDANDNLLATKNPAGNATAYGYDSANRLVIIYHIVSLNFDAQGNLTGWQYDPNNLTTFTYDTASGHLLSITNPEGRKQTFENYNSSGLPQVIKSTSGFAMSNVYDSLSRLKSINDPANNKISFEYTNTDQIKSITTSAGTSYLYYDANNNLTSIKDAKAYETAFNYDAKNNLQNVTDPEQGQAAYAYDKYNNLKTVILPNNTKLGYDFDDYNRLVLAQSGMGTPMPVIAVIEDSLDLGTAVLGSAITKPITVYNIGTKELSITAVSCNNNLFSIDTSATFIPAGENFTFNITFTPLVEGQASGILSITSDDPDAGTTTVSLIGACQLPSIAPKAYSTANGVQIQWQQYTNPTARFDHYSVYRSTSAITNITSLTPITTISNITATIYTDTTAAGGSQYYYTVVAFDANGNKLTAIESYGPVENFTLGLVGEAVTINSAYHDLNSTIVYNPAQKEYLAVYQYDASGSSSNYDIYGQRIGANGQKTGGAFAILNSGYTEKNPGLVYNNSRNEYLVVGEYNSNGSGAYRVRAQRVSASGSLVGSPVDIFSTSNGQYNPCVSYNSSENKYTVGFECDYLANGRTQLLVFGLAADGNILWGKYFNAGASASFKNPKVAYNTSLNQNLFNFEYTDSSAYSYIARLRLDASGNQLGNINYVGLSNKSFNPEVIYNPDRNEYASVWQYDYSGDGQVYKIAAMRISGDGTAASSVRIYTGLNSLFNPAITYFKGKNEYLLTFTNNYDTTQFDVFALRLSGADLAPIFNSFLSAYLTLGVSTKAEKNNGLDYNSDNQEFLAGFECDTNGDGSNWDVISRRIGILTLSLSVDPTSLDFGSADNQKILQIINSGGAPMYLRITSNQPWLTPAQMSVYTTGSTYNHNVYVSRANLNYGNYSGNIHIDYGGGALNVPVTMSVTAQPPEAPSGPSPVNGAVNQKDLGSALTVTMSWLCNDPDTGDSLTYDLYFSDDSGKVNNLDVSSKVSSNQTQNSYKSAALQYRKTYYWRVLVKDSHGLSSTGPVWSFTTVGIPCPQLIPYTPDPTNNKRPTLSWNSVAEAAKYHLQISTDSNFSSFIINDTNVTNNSYTLISDLPDVKIYWRLSSITLAGNEGAFSESDDFVVKTTLPQIPVLIPYAPNPTKEQKPVLNWQAIEGAASYHLQISNTADFSNLVVDKYVTGASYTPETNLGQGLIYWRLSSKDQSGNESGFSAPGSFRIDITPPAKITGLNAAVIRDKVTLTWNVFTDTDADFRHFNIYRGSTQITNVSGMAPISEAITEPFVTSFIDSSVTEGVKYYYALSAEDVLGNEDKSVVGIGPAMPQNQPPVLNAIGNKAVNEGGLLEFIISAADPDNSNLIYSVSGLPLGAYFSPNKKLFSWLPGYNQQGSYPIHFEVSDGLLTDSEDITITVNHTPVNPASGKSVGIKLKVRVVQE